MADGPLKVMVVDGHSVFAEALALAIDTTGDLACVGTARDVQQALALASRERPQVAVMDVQTEDSDPVHSMRRLLEQHPDTQVLVLTGRPLGPALVREVAGAGASGLLPKSVSLGVVVEAIPALRSQSFAIDRASLVSLCGAAPGGATLTLGRPGGSVSLTRRELDILGLLASGVDMQRAATRLGITINTARGYVKNLYRKLGVHNQLELVAVARERGLLDTTR
jgi:SARP family transcriptional regulator, regulator of embCAB operon